MVCWLGSTGASGATDGGWRAASASAAHQAAAPSLAAPPPPPPLAPQSGAGGYVMPGEDYERATPAMAALRAVASLQWPWVMLAVSTVMLAFVLGTPSEGEDPCLLV